MATLLSRRSARYLFVQLYRRQPIATTKANRTAPSHIEERVRTNLFIFAGRRASPLDQDHGRSIFAEGRRPTSVSILSGSRPVASAVQAARPTLRQMDSNGAVGKPGALRTFGGSRPGIVRASSKSAQGEPVPSGTGQDGNDVLRQPISNSTGCEPRTSWGVACRPSQAVERCRVCAAWPCRRGFNGRSTI